jgi:hypothetical protein
MAWHIYVARSRELRASGCRALIPPAPGLAQAAMSVSIYWHRKLTRTAKTAKAVRSPLSILEFLSAANAMEMRFLFGPSSTRRGKPVHSERIKLRLLSRMKPHPTGAYRHSVEKIFPRLGETATTDDVLKNRDP